MQHAEAHERLSDLALEPGRLARLQSDPAPEAVELLRHVESCERCATDLAGWQRTWAEVEGVLPGSGARPDEAGLVRAPASLRARTLAAATTGRSVGDRAGARFGPPSPGAGRPAAPIRYSLPWTLAAAALIVAVLGGGWAWTRSAELEQLRDQTAGLEAVAATFNRVLAAPKHWAVTLRTADGTAGGTLAWTTDEIVVVTSGLPAPGAGQAYRCWVETDGVRVPMGTMTFSGSTGFWSGSMYDWAESIGPGTRYGVSLVPDGGQGTPVLIGSL